MESRSIYEEQDILARIAGGDEEAFSQLFHRYSNRIYSIALKLTASVPLSEEIVLDVFLKLWLKKERLPALEHFTAYLFTITRNHVFSTLKQLSLRQGAEDEVRFGEYLLQSAQADYSVMDKEYRQILQAAIDQLTPRQREIYSLMKEQGIKREEVAARLGLSPETVKRHLADAMQAIRVFCLSRLDLVAVFMILRHLL